MSSHDLNDHRERYKFAMKIMEGILTEAEKPDDSITYPDFRVIRDLITIPGRELPVMDNTHLFYELDFVEESAIGADMRVFTEYTAIKMLHRSMDNLDNFLSNAIATDEKGETHRIGDIVSSDLRLLLLEKLTEYTILEVVSNLTEKMEDVIAELEDEASLFAQATFLDEFWDELKALGVVKVEVGFLADECERILTKAVAKKRTSLRTSFRDIWLPNLKEIGWNYRHVLPIWQDAKLLYKQNRDRANWREIIKAAHPDLVGCEDLISRLSGKLNDLPEEVQAKLSEKGGDSKPSSIALEHAARLCGAKDYAYCVRHLYYNLRRYDNGERNEDD